MSKIAPPMGGVLPYGQVQEPRPTRPTAGQGPRGSPNQAATTLTPGESGAHFTIEFSDDSIEVNGRLGLLQGAFKGAIEKTIRQTLAREFGDSAG